MSVSTLFSVVSLESIKSDRTIETGSVALDKYLREQAGQDMRRRVAYCFVALTNDKQIAGYYTLSAGSIPLYDLPQDLIKKLPRYPSVPIVRMGRLAVDKSFQGQGLGGALLADALERALKSEIAAYAMVVDAKDDNAVAFYQHHGFFLFPLLHKTLFLPFSTIFPKLRSV